MRRRTSRRLRLALERFEERNLPGAGLATAHFAASRVAPFRPGAAAPLLTTVDASGRAGAFRRPGFRQPPPRPPLFRSFSLAPDSGPLVPPFGQVRADSSRLVPGAVYNLSFLTVRNATSQAFDAKSGFSVQVSGQAGPQPFPLGSSTWKPGGVIVFYTLSRAGFPPSYTFNLNGSIQEKPANLNYNIQYNPSTFPGVLNAIAARSVGARYRLV